MTDPVPFKLQGTPASEEQIQNLLDELDGPLPADFLDFLRQANGAEGGPNDACGDSLRILPTHEILPFNEGYGVFEYLPDHLCFASDGGDYAFAFERSNAQEANMWNIVRVPLGALFIEDLTPVAADFRTWFAGGFRYEV